MIIFTDPTASGILHINMGRNSTSLLAAIVLVSAALSSGTKSGQLQVNAPIAPVSPKPHKNGYSADQLQLEYPTLLNQLIGDECQSGFPSTTKTPLPDSFIIALAPDPLHTHLALTFGRTMEVIQEALQDEGYAFVESLMPWDAKTHPESDELSERLNDLHYQRVTETYPGVLVFHRQTQPLCVLVVGESPTGGVNDEQFGNAIEQIKSATGVDLTSRKAFNPPPWRPGLRILGPTFSGSLQSLAQLLGDCKHPAKHPVCYPGVSIHSGTVSSADAITAFANSSVEHKMNARLVTFQESDKVLIERFIEYARGSAYGSLGYGKESVALVSEDETAYGSYNTDTKETNPNTKDTIGVRLYFPREISQLRAAYAKEIPAGDSDKSAPRDILPPNGDVPGDDEDSVTEFSPAQTVRSQEGVMQGLAAELRRHKIEFVIVRATDPMDTLFVSRYLRKAYPEGRVVTIGADMLFRREAEDPELHGLLSLSTYSLAPTGNHGFHAYEDGGLHLDRVFPSSNETGTYNALRSLMTAWVDGASATTGDRVELQPHAPRLGPLPLFQYGRQTEFRATHTEQKAAVDENAPPVRLLALGRDGYWPVATLGAYDKEPPTHLPVVPSQIANELDPLELPQSWRAVQLVTAGLALAFCLMLWFSSVFSHSPALAKFAPACSDARSNVILISGSAFMLIIFLLLWPSIQEVGLHRADLPLFLAGLLVIGITRLELTHRAELPIEPNSNPNWWALHWTPNKIWIFPVVLLLLVSCFSIAAFWPEPDVEAHALLRRFAILRATRLTSGLSFIMPIFFFLGAWIWWSGSVVGGHTLLDPRRPQLPEKMTSPELVALGQRIPKDLQRVLRPGVWDVWNVVFMLAIAAGLLILIEPEHLSHLSLEPPLVGWLIVTSLALALGGVVGSTVKLWQIWVELRRLLAALDSVPLGRAFKELKDFRWKPIWRSGSGNYAESQRIVARERETLLCAMNTVPEILWQKTNLENEWQATLDAAGDALKCKRPFSRDWLERRELESALITQFRRYRQEVASAAASAFDYVAIRWCQQREEGEHAPNSIDLKIHACERFVCFVYIDFLLAMLTRIRTLIVAIGGMYVLILIGTTLYPFEPRTGIQLLLFVLLASIIAAVGTVFAQMHRDTTLSHITDTHPGELGSDFWIRMGSFVALPLFTLFTSQFPSVNRLFYSWIRPAIESLNH